MTESDHITPASPPPKWVEKMHEHFKENGFYRAEDMQRIFGDLRECVEVKASSDLMQVSRIHSGNK